MERKDNKTNGLQPTTSFSISCGELATASSQEGASKRRESRLAFFPDPYLKNIKPTPFTTPAFGIKYPLLE
jgi:hypothetical protein